MFVGSGSVGPGPCSPTPDFGSASRPRSVRFPEGHHFRSRKRTAPPGNDLDGLLPPAEFRLLARSPRVAKYRLSSHQRLDLEVCPMKKVVPGTPRLGVLGALDFLGCRWALERVMPEVTARRAASDE